MDPVLFQVTASFVLSALVVILITIIAERYGTKLGGLIGTLPSTGVIAFLFFGLNRGPVFASEAVGVVPAVMGINLVFLCVFVLLAYSSKLRAVIIALFIWFLLAGLLYLFQVSSIIVSLVIYVICLVFMFLILEKGKKIKSTKRATVQYTVLKILARGVLAGTVIATAVYLSNLGAVLSGIFSTFPAIFLSTMVISVQDHGADFAGGIAKSMMLGSISFVGYATAVHVFYPLLDLFWGTLLSFVFALMLAACVFVFERRVQ